MSRPHGVRNCRPNDHYQRAAVTVIGHMTIYRYQLEVFWSAALSRLGAQPFSSFEYSVQGGSAFSLL
jgi:hypothetical protein